MSNTDSKKKLKVNLTEAKDRVDSAAEFLMASPDEESLELYKDAVRGLDRARAAYFENNDKSTLVSGGVEYETVMSLTVETSCDLCAFGKDDVCCGIPNSLKCNKKNYLDGVDRYWDPVKKE